MSTIQHTAMFRNAFIFLLTLTLAISVSAREVVPAPENGGTGLSVLPADNQPIPVGTQTCLPADPMVSPQQLDTSLKDRLGDIGGRDLLVRQHEMIHSPSMDIAANGDIYLALQVQEVDTILAIEIYISRDGGDTFELWGLLDDPVHGYFHAPVIKVLEGTISGVFVMYSNVVDAQTDIRMSVSPLGGASASFGAEITVMSQEGVSFDNPSFDTDINNYGAFYMYVVADGTDSLGRDIWFTRSTNQGASFESAYQIASLEVEDRIYFSPDISYGFGGHLHVAWTFGSTIGAFDTSVRYRRASNFANAGLGDWDYWVTMTSTSDGFRDYYPSIHAGQNSDHVVLAYSRFISPTNSLEDARVFVSDDSGASFAAPVVIPGNLYRLGDIAEDVVSGTWYLVSEAVGHLGIWEANVADLSSWTGPQYFNDEYENSNWTNTPVMALDSMHGMRPAVAWMRIYVGADSYAYFDAEWQGDPGVPNAELGFPLGLFGVPLSPPALVDVDGDGDLEIVFSDNLHQIQVFNHDNSPAPGWPVDVGVDLSDGPVAIGDLNGDGNPILVVGGTDGNAYAYDHLGNLLPGWPSAITPPGHDIYVSIGAVGEPYTRSVICAGANYITLRNRRGVAPPNTVGWSIGGEPDYTSTPAIGDLDGNGVSEIVAGLGTSVFAFEKGEPSIAFRTILPSALSDALTLGDLDLDGDLEILCPTVSGILYVLDHTGAHVGGNFPYDTGISSALTSAAIAQCLGTAEPEIAVANLNSKVHLLWDDGASALGFPVSTSSGWYLYGAPIIGAVEGSSSDVVIGDRGRQMWAWDNGGFSINGWPEGIAWNINLSPAMADIDLDGSNEIVVLTDGYLTVFDVNNAVNDARGTWAMYGHDPQRTGCADCPEDLVTGIDTDSPSGTITRVSFAGPTPNPVSGMTQFAFAVPARAAVKLEIIDLRGRRVFTVYQEEMESGSQVVTWNGQDSNGEPVASGQYFARLQVRGPGVDEMMTRKVVVVR